MPVYSAVWVLSCYRCDRVKGKKVKGKKNGEEGKARGVKKGVDVEAEGKREVRGKVEGEVKVLEGEGVKEAVVKKDVLDDEGDIETSFAGLYDS